jgi:site-specific DNA-adenine methylase
MKTKMPTIGAIAPWFGGNRTLAHHVGAALKGCSWVGVPFAGGMSELPHIDAISIAVNDRHCAVINLALIIADPIEGPHLYRRLRRHAFHPQTLARAQHACESRHAYRNAHPCDFAGGNYVPSLDWAEAYFVAVWMGRSGTAGTDHEFEHNLSIRWNANGGDSTTRYRSAVKALVEWRRILARCSFSVLDCFDFLAKCQDQPGHGIYCDPPFLDVGQRYRHSFSLDDHARLAHALAKYTQARVVCRFYDHPLIRQLYPERGTGTHVGVEWIWKRLAGGRKQSNKPSSDVPEVLVMNRQPGGSLFD